MSSSDSFAVSRRVNPKGASIRLTEAQVWKGLEIKARQPKAFIPVITSSEVVSDTGNKVVRQIQFGEAPAVTEEIDLYEAAIVYFEMEGKRITNILSYDEDDELWLTFTFTEGVPGAPPGTGPKELRKIIGAGIDRCTQRFREMVQDETIVA